VPFLERDAWVDAALGITDVPEDDAHALGRDAVPYLPAPVDAVLQFVEHAQLDASDLVVDVGSGLGRVATLIHRLCGASVIGIERQPALVARARRFENEHVRFMAGDALEQATPEATAYFLYCPFSGATLERWLDRLPRQHDVWLGCVGVPLPSRSWLELLPPPSAELDLYRARAGDFSAS
jgi:protein-L-isoaspartate O-methyltransferase